MTDIKMRTSRNLNTNTQFNLRNTQTPRHWSSFIAYFSIYRIEVNIKEMKINLNR